MDEPKLSDQLQAIIDRISGMVPELATVTGLEEMDDALKTDALLPAAVVIYSGDWPERLDNGRQSVRRYWSIVLIMDLQNNPMAAIDLVQVIGRAIAGFWPAPGVGMLTLAGANFVTKFDNTRVAYEVRCVGDAWIIYND